MLPSKNNFHILEHDNGSILFDVPTNTILTVDSEFKSFLHGNNSCEDSLNSLKQLNLLGLLAPQYTPGLKPYKADIYKLSLEVFSGCNMRCLYCYAHISNKVEQKPLKASWENIKKSLDFFVKEFGKEAKAFEVNIVGGGEPLLNFEIIKKIKTYCEELEQKVSKKIVFWIFTNGTVFTKDIIDYLIKKRQGLTISLDGPAEIQDYLRPLPNQKGSFETIEKWINTIKTLSKEKSGIQNLWASAVITSKHTSLVDVLKKFKELGIKKAQVRPIRTKDPNLTFDHEQIQNLNNLYLELTKFLIKEALELNFEHLNIILNDRDYFGRQIIRLVNYQGGTFRCGAAKSKLSIRADGNIYPCDIGSDIGDLKVGDINSFKINNDSYFDLHVDKKPVCKDCWARYLCGGGCYVAAQDRNGQMKFPDPMECEIVKIMIESAILFIFEINQNNPQILNRIRKYCALQHKIINKVYNI